MTKTATKLHRAPGVWTGAAYLYRCTPAFEGHEYVVSSAATCSFRGPETMVFPADADGDVPRCIPVGEVRGVLDPDAPLIAAGYTIETAGGVA